MREIAFPKDFIWGTCTSAYQIEGSHNVDGKGESIWDRYSHVKGNIANNDNGDTACDHYRLYRDDVKLLKDLGVKSYRFSVSWPRILPDGKGRVNQKGLDFYRNLSEMLSDNGIKPMAALYHWDLPQKLQDAGGWTNRDTASHFEEYARVMFDSLGDTVKLWATFNEPWVSSFVGHFYGGHPPCGKSLAAALTAAHNTLLAHGKAAKAFRETGHGGEIGIILNLNPVYPASENDEDYRAALRYGDFLNGWFLDPVLKGKYPEYLAGWLEKRGEMIEYDADDLKIMNSKVDYIGVNSYSSSSVKHDPGKPPFEFSFSRTGKSVTDTGWEIYPEGLYDLLKYIDGEYDGIRIMITENGAAFKDTVDEDGSIRDIERVKFLHDHIIQVHRALNDGVNIAGYYVWSFLDNFEWKMGYGKRFGLVYVDYKTQKRIVKQSGKWYSKLCKAGRLVYE